MVYNIYNLDHMISYYIAVYNYSDLKGCYQVVVDPTVVFTPA